MFIQLEGCMHVRLNNGVPDVTFHAHIDAAVQAVRDGFRKIATPATQEQFDLLFTPIVEQYKTIAGLKETWTKLYIRDGYYSAARPDVITANIAHVIGQMQGIYRKCCEKQDDLSKFDTWAKYTLFMIAKKEVKEKEG